MRKNQEKSFKTTCSYCGVGCGIVVQQDAKGKIRVEGDPDHPTNQGLLCSKGLNLHYVASDYSDRLLYPEMRWAKNQPRQRVSWDTALDRAAAVFRSLIAKHGPDAVGFYISGQCLTEEYYIANKLVKGFLGTNNIDTNSRLCMSSAVVGYKKPWGKMPCRPATTILSWPTAFSSPGPTRPGATPSCSAAWRSIKSKIRM